MQGTQCKRCLPFPCRYLLTFKRALCSYVIGSLFIGSLLLLLEKTQVPFSLTIFGSITITITEKTIVTKALLIFHFVKALQLTRCSLVKVFFVTCTRHDYVIFIYYVSFPSLQSNFLAFASVVPMGLLSKSQTNNLCFLTEALVSRHQFVCKSIISRMAN